MSDLIDDLIYGLQRETAEGRAERILAELREHHPDVYDHVALADIAVIAAAAEVVTWLDLGEFMRQGDEWI